MTINVPDVKLLKSERLNAEAGGGRATGTTPTDCAPINPLTGQPYFLILKEGWGSGWEAAPRSRRSPALEAGHLIRWDYPAD